MRALVTGSNGRVGTVVARDLLERGIAVRGFDLMPSGRTEPDYEEVVGALEDPEAVAKAVAGMDTVVHLGAYMSWSPGDWPRLFRANVEGTRVALDAAARAGVNRFVFASSGEVYPENAPTFLPITEDHPLLANSPYGLTKLLGEEMVRFQQRTGAMETVILRFSHIQDASELLDEDSFFSGPRFFLAPRIRQQERFGNHALADLLLRSSPGGPAHILARNEAGRPFRMHITDTRDIAHGILLSVVRPEAAGGVFNLGSTEPVDFGWLLPRMSEITGYPVVPVDLPGPGVDYHTSNQRIRTVLGFEPQWTMRTMLAEAAEARSRGQTATCPTA